jgi:hypothetical protein
VTLPRYYALEARAVAGLVSGCEPGGKGRQVTAERQAERLRREVERLRREVARRQALVRMAQRMVGLTPPAGRAEQKRKRRPLVRALRVAKVLSKATAVESEDRIAVTEAPLLEEGGLARGGEQ